MKLAKHALVPLAFFLASMTPRVAWAADDAPPATVEAKLEDIVRTPPKVLQNRYFLKKFRPEISIFGGSVLNESYSQTWVGGARLGLFVTEEIGIDAVYSVYSSSASADLEVLQQLRFLPFDPNNNLDPTESSTPVYPEPSFTRLQRAAGGILTYAPIYGKINFADMMIIYSDIYLAGGAAALDTTDSAGNKHKGLSVLMGFGQRFYVGRHFSLRLEAMDNMFIEERRHLDTSKKSTHHAWQAVVGLCLFIL